ncbi:uncharacterized protein FPRN_03851 [Fusarium proliferatum]|nr:uncharacterized protein FPRN_03851 [Fusarium proliferatum]
MESHDIYTGIWRNYSTAGLDGKVITLPIQSAGYLISGLTVLLTLAVGSCWTIAAYALHQCHVSDATDPLELQLQVLLRNVEKPTSAAWHLAKIWWAWRKSSVRHVRKLLCTGLFAIIFAAAIVPVGTIVASIASTREEVVLVLAKPRNCGYVRSNFSVSSSNDAFAASFAYTTDKAIRGRAYAKAWYRNAEASRRDPPSSFPVARLPYRNDTVPCPLKGNRCRYYAADTNDENMAIALDTGLLDTGAYLGINGPKEHMIQFRKKTTCAPTRIPDLWVPYQDGSDNFTALKAGPYEGPGNITLKFNTRIRDENVGYVTGFAVIDPGATSASLDQWQPTDPFKHDDAILTLHAILPNVVYLGPVNDPMFLASGKSKKMNLGKLTYRSDYFITSLVCLDQVQVCNQNNRKCSSLTHNSEAFRQGETDLDLNSQQLGVLKRVISALVDSTTFQSGIAPLGSTGLLASELVYNNAISPPLPDDQWIKEVTLWFQTGLSILQEQIMLFLDISAYNDTSGAFILEPVKELPGKDRAELEWQCAAQKIPSQGQVQNFHFAAVIVIGTVSATIILIGLILEPLIGWTRKPTSKEDKEDKKEKKEKNKRQLARDMDSLYWLLRAALLGIGVTAWNDDEGDIPVTTTGVTVQHPGKDDRECCQRFYIADRLEPCLHEIRSGNLPSSN